MRVNQLLELLMKGAGICILLPLLFSCGNRQTTDDRRKISVIPISILDTLDVSGDTLTADMLLVNPPSTQKGDGVFEDFIFNFSADEAMQKEHIRFPLPYNDSSLSYIQKETWIYEPLLGIQNYYTLLFDSEQDMDLVGSEVAQGVAQLERIYLKDCKQKKYYFECEDKHWMLDSISVQSLPSLGGKGEDFYTFYARFVTDTVYQSQRINFPLLFITLDPDDEFNILETTLDLNQWKAFRPMLPTETLTNICYGQRNDTRSRKKILKVNGIGNGYTNIFYFRRQGGKWILYKYEDTGV